MQWFVAEGDEVDEFGQVCQVQHDKASVDITSPYAGGPAACRPAGWPACLTGQLPRLPAWLHLGASWGCRCPAVRLPDAGLAAATPGAEPAAAQLGVPEGRACCRSAPRLVPAAAGTVKKLHHAPGDIVQVCEAGGSGLARTARLRVLIANTQ